MTYKSFQINPFITEERIQEKVQDLGRQLTKKFLSMPSPSSGEQRELVAICVLNGSILFFADLVRAMDLDVKCEFLGVSSYHGKTHSSGEVKLTLDLNTSIENKDVLLVEDVIDSGLTLQYLQKILKARNPASLTTVGLLVKPPILDEKKVNVDYFGFTTQDFVIGFGMDYEHLYRNLPYIASMRVHKKDPS